jgi:hypothetical protein
MCLMSSVRLGSMRTTYVSVASSGAIDSAENGRRGRSTRTTSKPGSCPSVARTAPADMGRNPALSARLPRRGVIMNCRFP